MGRCWYLRCKARILCDRSSERSISKFTVDEARSCLGGGVFVRNPLNLSITTSLKFSTLFDELRKNGNRTTIVAAGSLGNCVVQSLECLCYIRLHPHGNTPLYKDGQKKDEMGTRLKFKCITELSM